MTHAYKIQQRTQSTYANHSKNDVGGEPSEEAVDPLEVGTNHGNKF